MNHLEIAKTEIDNVQSYAHAWAADKQRHAIANALIAIAEQLEIANNMAHDTLVSQGVYTPEDK